MKRYNNTVVDGITIWYDRNIAPEQEGEPIIIDARKLLFTYDLRIRGAKQYLKTT